MSLARSARLIPLKMTRRSDVSARLAGQPFRQMSSCFRTLAGYAPSFASFAKEPALSLPKGGNHGRLKRRRGCWVCLCSCGTDTLVRLPLILVLDLDLD